MKKAFVIALVLLVAVGMTVTAVSAAPKLKPPSGEHYNLNIIGKDWEAGAHEDQFDNYDRHTMFIPLNTTDWMYTIPELGEPDDVVEPTFDQDSVGLRLTQGEYSVDDFDVVDGNAFDDGWCWLDFPDDGAYSVWIAVKANKDADAYTTFTSNIYYENETQYFLIPIGSTTVKKKGWTDASDLLYVDVGEALFTEYYGEYTEASFTDYDEGMWLFDYIDYIEWAGDYVADDEIGPFYDFMAFWDIKNMNNKLIQLRFYQR